MTLLEALILGLVQGLTEFLPVSSSGHLEIGKWVLGAQEADLGFSIWVHAATALSTLTVFRSEVLYLVRGSLRAEPAARGMVGLLVLSAVPAGIVGFGFKDALEAGFINRPDRVGMALLVTAALLAATDIHVRRTAYVPAGPWADSPWRKRVGQVLAIGLAQAFAILPGISRSGSTIATSLWVGVPRSEAARFSFLMALIPIAGATLLEVKDLLEVSEPLTSTSSPGAYAVGAIAAYISGLFACTWMIRLVSNVRLAGFAVYCAILGIVAVMWA
ncbi:MAG: undecaprenyl-diphosphate phosphatase [Flavobacteriales bacterium]